MTPELDGVKVLAVDLVGTLTKKVNMTFAARGAELLDRKGWSIEPATFRRLYRKRYLEYSMGNYANDREFYSALSVDLSIPGGEPWLQALTGIWMEYCTPFHDAQPFLERASQNHKLILSSNYIADWVRRILVKNHWGKFFQALVVSSECRFRKPSQQFFLELLKVSGVTSPDEVLVIGDSPTNDVYGATQAGLRAVFVARNIKAHESKFLISVPCVQSLHELVPCQTGEQAVAAKDRP